jgi:hypothetical protein
MIFVIKKKLKKTSQGKEESLIECYNGNKNYRIF